MNISIFNKLFFYQIGPVIDPKMRNLQKIIGFLLKIQLYLNMYVLITDTDTDNDKDLC